MQLCGGVNPELVHVDNKELVWSATLGQNKNETVIKRWC
jgi:hypothetical protein